MDDLSDLTKVEEGEAVEHPPPTATSSENLTQALEALSTIDSLTNLGKGGAVASSKKKYRLRYKRNKQRVEGDNVTSDENMLRQQPELMFPSIKVQGDVGALEELLLEEMGNGKEDPFSNGEDEEEIIQMEPNSLENLHKDDQQAEKPPSAVVSDLKLDVGAPMESLKKSDKEEKDSRLIEEVSTFASRTGIESPGMTMALEVEWDSKIAEIKKEEDDMNKSETNLDSQGLQINEMKKDVLSMTNSSDVPITEENMKESDNVTDSSALIIGSVDDNLNVLEETKPAEEDKFTTIREEEKMASYKDENENVNKTEDMSPIIPVLACESETNDAYSETSLTLESLTPPALPESEISVNNNEHQIINEDYEEWCELQLKEKNVKNSKSNLAEEDDAQPEMIFGEVEGTMILDEPEKAAAEESENEENNKPIEAGSEESSLIAYLNSPNFQPKFRSRYTLSPEFRMETPPPAAETATSSSQDLQEVVEVTESVTSESFIEESPQQEEVLEATLYQFEDKQGNEILEEDKLEDLVFPTTPTEIPSFELPKDKVVVPQNPSLDSMEMEDILPHPKTKPPQENVDQQRQEERSKKMAEDFSLSVLSKSTMEMPEVCSPFVQFAPQPYPQQFYDPSDEQPGCCASFRRGRSKTTKGSNGQAPIRGGSLKQRISTASIRFFKGKPN